MEHFPIPLKWFSLKQKDCVDYLQIFFEGSAPGAILKKRLFGVNVHNIFENLILAIFFPALKYCILHCILQ